MHSNSYRVDLIRAVGIANCSERFILSQLNECAAQVIEHATPVMRSLFRQYWLALRLKRNQIPQPSFVYN